MKLVLHVIQVGLDWQLFYEYRELLCSRQKIRENCPIIGSYRICQFELAADRGRKIDPF
tara:strand:+ start:479 stop:655 length:177 start_codon:yes stop_codon:yes gene_type:complete